METSKYLKVHLLQAQPKVIFENGDIDFSGQSLELFMYLADTYRDSYTRSDLLVELYGSDGSLKMLRQNALFYMPALIKEQFIDARDQAVIQFHRDRVWVDSREFAQQASTLLAHSPLTEHQQVLEAQRILDIYQNHFLQDYIPKADGLIRWRDDRQQELANLRHNLFDQIIQYYLWCASLEEARHYAELWHESLDPGYLPLQYLIWIAANRGQNAQLEVYLGELRKKETKEKRPSPIGPSASAWRRHLQQHDYLPLALLRLTPHIISHVVLGAYEDQIIGHEMVLRDILTIFSDSNRLQILCLTGLPGAGKTTLAQIVAQSFRRPSSGYDVVFIQLRPDPDFESILNEVLRQLRMDHLITSNYVKKQRHIKQQLQRRRCFIVIDEGNTRRLNDSTVFQTLRTMLDGANLLFVAQQISDTTYDSITVEGLQPGVARQLMVRQLPGLNQVDETLFGDLVQITGGLPFGLNLIAGFIKERRFQLNTFVSALKHQPLEPMNQSNVYPRYEDVLSWLWTTLSSNEKLILYAVSMFDSTNGATTEDISTICNDLRPDQLQSKIDLLISLSLLRSQQRQDGPARFTLHSIIHNFVRGKALQLPNQPARLDVVERAYILHLLKYTEANYEQFPLLDAQRENIIRMFELVLLNIQHTDLVEETLETFCLVYPYLEKRGLYNVADTLIAAALQLKETPFFRQIYVQLLYHAGQVAYKRSNLDTAERFLEQAIASAQAIEATELYAALHLDRALVYLQKEQYLDAMNNFEEAHQWAEHHGQLLLLCRVAGNSGVCAIRQGLYEQGRQYYEQVRTYIGARNIQDLTYELKDVLQFAFTGLGAAAAEQWDYVKAEIYYQQAMEIARQVNNPERIGYLYLNLGVANFYIKDYQSAHNYFLQGKIIADHIQHDELSTFVMWNRGALISAQHQYEEAAGLLKLALQQAVEINLPWMQTGIYIVLGKLFFRQNILERARQCFLRALAIAGRNPKFLAPALYGLGLVEVSEYDVIGSDDRKLAEKRIGAMLDRLGIDRQRLLETNYKELEKAQWFFQHDLDGYPNLERFRIAEGLWGCSPSRG